MEKALNRRDVGYTIVSRFETALRLFISNTLLYLYSDFKDGVPLGIYSKALDRANATKFDDITDLLEYSDYIDLSEIIVFKGSYQKFFPDNNMLEEVFKDSMQETYLLRCKIAHVNGYFTSLDLDRLVEFCKIIGKELNDIGKEFTDFITELEKHPENVVVPMPISFTCDRDKLVTTPNNLPMPDYEYEGGFIGRDQDRKAITKLLVGDLHRVITIAGAGGVGKSALALKVVNDVLIKSPTLFDGAIWLSAKEDRLSYVGIEELEPSLKNYENLLETILDVLGYGYTENTTLTQMEEDVKTLFDLHKNVLLIVDNFETVKDFRIVDFILDSPKNCKILVTSRRGIGQVERRYELQQLKEKEAVYLFRQVARDKNLSTLAKLDEITIVNYVNKVSCYPLAIKWVIGRASLGHDIHLVAEEISNTSSDISLFCFDQIFNSLSTNSRILLSTLSYFEQKPSPGIVKYVSDLSTDHFSDSIRELILVSLIIPEQSIDSKGEIESRYGLLPLTRGYVRKQLDGDTSLKRDIDERYRSVQTTAEEAVRAKKQYRFSLQNLGASTEEEKVASMLVQTAFQKYQAGRYDDAVSDYRRASEIAPNFSSIYRNWAVMESMETHYASANELMTRASKLSPNDAQIWLTWGNMARKEDKISEAETYYGKAQKIRPNDYVILNALGQVKCRQGEFSHAHDLFIQALKMESTGSSIKHNIINKSSIADNLRRWAEALEKDKNYEMAEKKYLEAIDFANQAFKLDSLDNKSATIVRIINYKLGLFYRNRNNIEDSIKYFKLASTGRPISFKETKTALWAIGELANIYYSSGSFELIKKLITNQVLATARRIDITIHKNLVGLSNAVNIEAQRVKGTIIRVNIDRQFMIIECNNSRGETYLGFKHEIKPYQITLDKEMERKNITFIPIVEKHLGEDKKVAKSINFIN